MDEAPEDWRVVHVVGRHRSWKWGWTSAKWANKKLFQQRRLQQWLSTTSSSHPSASVTAASTAGASPSQRTSANTRTRMRPNASILQQVLDLHKEDSLWAAEAEKRCHWLQKLKCWGCRRKPIIRHDGNDKEYFAARANKNQYHQKRHRYLCLFPFITSGSPL